MPFNDLEDWAGNVFVRKIFNKLVIEDGLIVPESACVLS